MCIVVDPLKRPWRFKGPPSGEINGYTIFDIPSVF